ncbi:AIPR family protein [Burkholderia cenocepacia]|uniref:AIPR family protein n=1 Tax=Burkholderia cenocepacia TaxID=95486 RepID=UPI002AB1FB51|nr:AIPR family protein [Burkholderia cenocepacia]
MHKIIKSHLESYVTSCGLEQLTESERFESFCNYSIVFDRVGASFDASEITTGPEEDGIDGVSVIINEEICLSKEDAEMIFGSDKRNNDVELVFVQSKTSESFDLGDFLKFKEGVMRFLEADPYESADDVLKSANETYNFCLSKVPKIRGGKPRLTARYAATGKYEKPAAIERAVKKFETEANALGYFANVDIKVIGREEITTLWVQTYSGVSAALPVFSSAALPPIAGVDEAYLVVAKAKDIVDELLTAKDGALRTQVFDENVRAFLGPDNPVNASIGSTLSDAKASTRFPVMNNGITIVSPDVRVQGNVIHLENFQIVNGCQTSNVLFEHRHSLNQSVMVNLKIVETKNEDIFADLVRATNSQSKIDDNQFYSLRPIVKRIEQYFNSFDGDESRLYFERRDRQFVGLEIPAIRIFSLYIVAKCVCAMLLRRPDLSYKYPKQMYDQLGEKIFAEKNKESIYYAAALSLYRFHLLRSNGIISKNLGKFKWHLIALVAELIAGKDMPELNSRSADKYAGKLIDTLSRHDKSVPYFKRAAAAVESLTPISDDRLKRGAILEELRGKL